VWVNGVVAALVGLAMILGNAIVAAVPRLAGKRAGVLMVSVAIQAVTAVLCGALTNFYVVVGLYLVYCLALGVAMPVKQAYLNAHIPSTERATIISLDSFFANIGGVVGQSAWGLMARARSIADSWVAAGTTLLLGIPLYWLARRGEQR
jgi:MFS family permease